MAAKKVLDILIAIESAGIATIGKASKELKDFTNQAGKASSGLDSFAKASQNFSNSTKKVTLILTGLITGFAALTKAVLNNADSTAKVADRIGLSTDALQELRVAATLTGVETRTLDMAMQRFSRRVADAVKQQERLGVELRKRHLKEHIADINRLQTELSKSIKQEDIFRKKIEELDDKIVSSREDTADKVRDIRRRGMDEAQQQVDLELQADEKLTKAKQALANQDYDRALALAQQAQDIYESLEDETKAINGVEYAGQQLETIYKQQRAEAKKALDAQKKISEDLRKSMEKLSASILKLVDNLRDLSGIKIDVDTKAGYENLNALSEKVKEASELKLDISPTGNLSGLAKELNELGIALVDSSGKTRQTEDILNDYADAIQKATSEQEKLRLAFVGFDSEGARVVNTLRNGSAGLNAMRQQARDMGLVIQQDLLRGAERANDAMYLLSSSISISLQKALIALEPTIISVVNALLQFLPTFQLIVEAIAPFLPYIIGIVGVLTSLGIAFITVINPIIQMTALIIPLIGAMSGILPIIATLGAALTGLYLLFTNGDLIMQTFISTVKVVFDEFMIVLNFALDSLKLFFDNMSELFISLGNLFVSSIDGVSQFALSWVSVFVDIYEKTKEIFSAIASYVGGIIDSIINWVSRAWDAIRGVQAANAQAGNVAAGMRTGGLLGGYGGGDRIKALLEAGEFVMKKESVRMYGADFFNRLNNLSIPESSLKFQDGGLVPAGQTNNFNFSAPINNYGSSDTAEAFRKIIIPELKRAISNNTLSIASIIKRTR